jgi:hypothetical protein
MDRLPSPSAEHRPPPGAAMGLRGFLCNPDLEMVASGLGAPVGPAWASAQATARLFALLAPMGSRVWLSRGKDLEALDGDALRRQAAQQGLYREDVAAGFPWNRSGQDLVAYAWDARADVAAGIMGLPLPQRTATTLECNSKVFSHAKAAAAGLEPGVFDHACAVENTHQLSQHLLQVPAHVAARWVLKPAQGFAGGGRIQGAGRTLTTRGRGRLTQLLQRDGAVLFEPWVDRLVDLSVQLWIPPAPAPVEVLAVTALHNSPAGRYQGNGDALELDPAVLTQARRAAVVAAGWLQAAGHTGAVGVDAFTYADPETGRVELRPITEINARFTLGLLSSSVATMAFGPQARWSFRLQPEVLFGNWDGPAQSAPGPQQGAAALASTHVVTA